MRRSSIICSSIILLLTACSDYTPANKEVRYDTATGKLIQAPCPDWGQPSTANVDSSLHSNYGCATHHNMAIQLDNPADLHLGHGENGADTEGAVRTVTRYRDGEIPAELQPMQATGQ